MNRWLDQNEKRGRPAWRWLFALLFISGLFAGPQGLPAAPARAAAQSSTLRLKVVSARSEPDHPGGAVAAGDPVETYRFIINVDNTGDPSQPRQAGCSPSDPGYPDSCDWPSIRSVPGAAPIFTQGDQSLLNLVDGIDLPDGKYLISVLADGYKLSGAYFTIPLPADAPVEVALQPHPLPPATMRIKVFEDISSTNGQFDAPGEHGLPGFKAVINDILGQVSTDIFGNPLCTTYDAAGEPDGITNCLVSDADGEITIPNLGPNRYDVLVTAPSGSQWVQTTTLEGSHSWDTWLQEGGSGLDNEFMLAGEPFPWTMFGYVNPTDQLNNTQVSGGIQGTIVAASVFMPWGGGGLPYYGEQWNGLSGAHVKGPVKDAWVALSDLQNGDTLVYAAPAQSDGSFQINNVPDGNYFFTYWDYQQHYILDWMQVTVSDGQMVDIGTPFLTGWFTQVEGMVFNDANANGKRDPGEQGVSDYFVLLKDRDNTEIDRMTIGVTTDHMGYYFFDRVYPMGSWMVLEAYNDRYYTTGVTYQVENQPEETTVLGAGVDIGILPFMGHTARVDWGVRAYEPGVNGGIVGTVFYDTTRNELDPRYQAVEGWAPGIPGLRVNVWEPLKDAGGAYIKAADGSYARGKLLNSALTETWEQPVDCQARDADGRAVDHPALLPPAAGGYRCLESPVMGLQIQNGFASLDGNYGFGTIWTAGLDPDTYEPLAVPGNSEVSMPAGDYLVEVEIPADSFGRPVYQVVKEEDINVFNGDQFAPQIPPPACVGPLHVVDVAGIGTDGPQAVDNPSFAEAGGSPYEGLSKPLCDTKLVTVSSGRSIAPTFNLFTDVPIPGKWKGYIIDDLTLATDPANLSFGEKAGVPNAPIGVYDFTGRLFTTITSDPNGMYEVLLPSTHSINCPSPSGVCPNVYYILGNDPGQPGALNPNYNPHYRTIGTSFEVWPGAMLPSDLAPTQIVTGLLAPGSSVTMPVQCRLDSASPQLYAVAQPYAVVDPLTNTGGQVQISGVGFGAQGPGSQVTLDGSLALPVQAWSDTQIVADIPPDTKPGAWQLAVRNDAGVSTVNGLTFHVLGDVNAGPFPATPVRDNFNRSNTFAGLGSSSGWAGDLLLFNINNNQGRSYAGGFLWWNPANAVFSADQEAYLTLTDISTTAGTQGVMLKFNGLHPALPAASWVEAAYSPASGGQVSVRTQAPGQGVVTRTAIPGAFVNGDRLGVRITADGQVSVYRNSLQIGAVNVTAGANPWPTGLALSGGRVGIHYAGTGFTAAADARFDDFGGGNITPAPTYRPDIYEAGPGKTYATIQAAIDAAAAQPQRDALVVVYPGAPAAWNGEGAYLENLLIYTPLKLQGVGPGGPDVPGAILDGRGVLGDSPAASAWRSKAQALAWDGSQQLYEGAVITLLAEDGEFKPAYPAAIDGFTIQGGDQQGFPGTLPDGAIMEIQGGGIFANGYARFLRITNNVLRSNGGAYGGAIRLGTPHLPQPLSDSQNDYVTIRHNRIIANGGTNLAGAIGIFSGAEGYQVDHNDICGNFSAEYGGGISHYGFSPNGQIHHNRIYLNRSYDEGGGILIAGELPANPAVLSPGSGPVDIFANLLQGNLANDDGGGIRFLMAGNFPMNVYNNIIVHNVSTHEGGGISLNDAPDVRVYNNSIMKNITTATAMTSDGQPAPAGLSSSQNSALLQA
ncbi:MAG: SdrD B-like domain-containing protein, partial [Chloroflexota bacterium]